MSRHIILCTQFMPDYELTHVRDLGGYIQARINKNLDSVGAQLMTLLDTGVIVNDLSLRVDHERVEENTIVGQGQIIRHTLLFTIQEPTSDDTRIVFRSNC